MFVIVAQFPFAFYYLNKRVKWEKVGQFYKSWRGITTPLHVSLYELEMNGNILSNFHLHVVPCDRFVIGIICGRLVRRCYHYLVVWHKSEPDFWLLLFVFFFRKQSDATARKTSRVQTLLTWKVSGRWNVFTLRPGVNKPQACSLTQLSQSYFIFV